VLLISAIVLTAFNLRTAVTGFSPLLETIGADLSFGLSLFGAFGTIVTASFAVFGFAATAIARRFGLEWTLVVATAATTVGIALRAASPGATTLILSTVVAFAGVGMTNVLIVPIVKQYFASRIKTVTSLYLSLLQLGQFTAPLLAVPVAVAAGWRVAIGMWAVLTALAFALWFVAAVAAARRRTRSAVGRAGASSDTVGDRVGTPDAPDAPDVAPVDSGDATSPVHGAWRSPLLWSMVLMFGMTALNTYAIITWLPTILVDAGIDPALGGALLALFSVFGLGAAFVVPPLAVGMRNPVVIVIVCVVLLAVGYTGLLVAPLEGAVIWVVALGLGVSTFPLCLTLVNVRTRTTAGSSLLSGAMQGIGYGLACVGPLLIGLLHDLGDGWGGSYLFLYATLGVLLVSGIVACRPQYLERHVERAPDACRGSRIESA
jgi:CP family cyanate transporter-like MFS transporter